MALVVSSETAQAELERILAYSLQEFGRLAARRLDEEQQRIKYRLSVFPKSDFPETLLEGRTREYRSCPLRKRFKMVYYYDEPTDTVHVMDFWDMRMSPTRLTKRMK